MSLRQNRLNRRSAAPHLLKSVPLDCEQRAFGRGGANRVAVCLKAIASAPAQARPTYL
jgi:hypothetical protein